MSSNARDPLRRYLARPSRRRYERLVREYAPFVWARALRVSDGHETDAEDLVQDVFLRLLLDPPPADSVRHSRAWLGWWVLSRAGHLRTAARRRVAREAESARRRPAPSSPEEAAHLRDAVEQLPAELSEVVSLRFFAGHSSGEVAERLGITESAVRKRVARARVALARRLSSATIAMLMAGDDPVGSVAALPSLVRDDLLRLADGVPGLAGVPVLEGGVVRSSAQRALGSARSLAVVAGSVTLIAAVGWWLVSGAPENPAGWDRSAKVVVDGGPSVGAPRRGSASGAVESSPMSVEGAAATGGAAASDVVSFDDPTPEPSLRGRFVSTDGDPIPHVPLTVECESCDPREWTPLERLEGEGTEVGRFELFDLPPGRYELIARPGGYGLVIERVDVPAADEIVFERAPVPHVRLRCVAKSTGELLRNTVVEYSARDAAAGSYGEPRPLRTDHDGFLRIGDDPGAIEIALSSGSRRASVIRAEIPREAPFPTVDVLFREGTSVRGRALSASGEPIPLARIAWQPWSQHVFALRRCEADDDGRYQIDGLTPGPYWVFLDEHATRALDRQRVEISASPLELRDLRFDAGRDQEFTLLDPGGAPVPGFPVECRVSTSNGHYTRGRELVCDPTDLEGRFSAQRVGSKAYFRFDVEDRELGYLFDEFELSEEDGPIALQFRPWVPLRGQLLDGAGEPVAGAAVRARSRRTELVTGSVAGNIAGLRHASPRRFRSASTDAGGRFELRLWPGTYAVDATLDDVVRTRAIDVDTRSANDLEDVVLTTEDLVAYRVRVIEADGRPVAGVSVSLESEGGSLRARAVSSDDGLVTVEALVDVYPLRKIWSKDRHRPVPPIPTVSPETPEATLVVEAQGDGLVEVRGVVLHDGRPVPKAWVRPVRHRGGRFGGGVHMQNYIQADQDGRFSVRNEPGATMWFSAHGPGFAIARSELFEIPSEESDVEIVVTPLEGEDLTVRAIDENGRAVPRVFFRFYPNLPRSDGEEPPPCAGWGQTDSEGRHVFEQLPAGDYALDSEGVDEELHAPRVEFTWPNEDEREITVTMQPRPRR